MAFEDQLDQTVERIIDEAIDFYMYCLGWTRHGGNYMNELMHGWEITPPGNPSRRSGGLCLYNGQPEHYAFEYGEGTNAASFVYAHFEDTIRDVSSAGGLFPTRRTSNRIWTTFSMVPGSSR